MEGAGATPELGALKTKLRATWIAGDFGQIAKAYTNGAEDFIKRLNLQPRSKVARRGLRNRKPCDSRST